MNSHSPESSGSRRQQCAVQLGQARWQAEAAPRSLFGWRQLPQQLVSVDACIAQTAVVLAALVLATAKQLDLECVLQHFCPFCAVLHSTRAHRPCALNHLVGVSRTAAGRRRRLLQHRNQLDMSSLVGRMLLSFRSLYKHLFTSNGNTASLLAPGVSQPHVVVQGV